MTASNPASGAAIQEEQLHSKELLDNKEINQAALKFKTGVVQAKRLAQSPNISKKAMARVLNAVIEFPLGDEYPKFTNKEEQALFNLTLELIDAKSLMINAVMQDTKNKADLLAAAATETTGETTNV